MAQKVRPSVPKLRFTVLLSAAFAVALSLRADVVVENARFRLSVGDDAVVRSLVLKATGEELLTATEGVPLVTVTQERLFNNEIKLAHPSRETTCRANRIRRDGDRLIVGFELVPYEAVIALRVTDSFVGFELAGFDVELADYQLGPQFPVWLDMKVPPVRTLRFLQLPVRPRANFGEWLNVCWDGRAALAVVGCEPMTVVGNERRKDFRLMTAEADAELRLEGAKAALIVSEQKDFLPCLDAVEVAYGLPRGVRDRANGSFNASVYWTASITKDSVDEEIALARAGGFRRMLVYHTAVCDHPADYSDIGSYAVGPAFGGDENAVRDLLGKAHAAGLKVGLHVLHPFVGLDSAYVHPVADHRLNLKRRFTLRRPLDVSAAGDLLVEENPFACPTNERSRVLVFGGELLTYTGFTTTRPYKFTGVCRGYRRTTPVAHPAGQIGGLLDICEFGGTAAYVDQNTDLQDELAEKIARIYNLGFDFFCMDGCEGVNAPYGIHVANAQYRVWRKLEPKPLYTEGAAKAHFAWHHLSGANAFDVFVPEEFKAMIVRWPQREAAEIARDFSRVSFGWWGFWLPGERLNDGTVTVGTQMDMWEFGTSRAAAWDSPTTIQFDPAKARRHPRLADLMEVMRRWEDVRAKGWLTPAQKELLKSSTRQHHLYVNDRGEYELHEIEMLVPENASGLRAFLFERNGRRIVAYWHTSGSGRFVLDDGEGTVLEAGGLRYRETESSREAVRRAFAVVRRADEGT